MDETNPVIIQMLKRIASTSIRIPAEPPSTFYEALNTIVFLFYVVQSIEGNGISVFGHPDRILLPYYRRDITAGHITPEEAKDLLRAFLAISDIRYGMKKAHGTHVGTNGTVTIGGCDKDGEPIFNELTEMILKAHQELYLIDPKINARISAKHPQEFYELLAQFIATGDNSLAIFNDDVIIPANVRMGKKPEDCRLYVGGGCQENVLANTEVNSRATIYLNLMHVFLMGFFPEKWAFFTKHKDFVLGKYHECAKFDDFYETFLQNLKIVVDAHIDERNRTESEGWRYNPCPLHSSTIDDCIEKGLDMMEGGARYSYGSISLTGIGTLIDSLFAVREVFYNRKIVSLMELQDILEQDFRGHEAFRLFLVNRIPKFGQDDEAILSFSSQVFADLARVTSGKPNSRGGCYEASLFSFRSFVGFGEKTGATPDGRKAGQHLSQGMSPSLLALGEKCSISQVLEALEPLDISLYPVVAVLDVKLPATHYDCESESIVPVIKRFLEAGGSVLQINYVDQEILREAKENPELHRDLIVRVSGYSSYFHILTEQIQDEIIARAIADQRRL
jgi:trans-4-hydroxy-L-proline dehydratase